MTERDLYVSCIPVIAEMAARCQKLTEGEYEDWKRESMKCCPETAREFIGKVFVVIDSLVTKSSAVTK